MVNLLAWAFSLILLSAATLLNYPLSQPDAKFTPLAYGLFDGCSRVMWSIGLCYIIFACVHNYGGPVNWFLAHPFWQPISKLSYSIYLAHFTVIQNIFWMKTPAYFSEMAAVFRFFLQIILKFKKLIWHFPLVVLRIHSESSVNYRNVGGNCVSVWISDADNWKADFQKTAIDQTKASRCT